MNPLTTVLSLPVADPRISLKFYRDGLGLATDGIEEGIVAFELPNLSLFLIERSIYDSYVDASGLSSAVKKTDGAAIISCAFASTDEIDEAMSKAAEAGGSAGAASFQDGSYMGYFSDPDGHVWELVSNEQTAQAAASG